MAAQTPLDVLKRCVEKYESCQSLQRLAMTHFVISLWSKPDIQNKLIRYSITSGSSRKKAWEWMKIEREIMAQAQNNIPSHVFTEVLESAMSNISSQMYEWLEYLKKYTWSNRNVPKTYITDIAWTDRGTVDKEKTFYLLSKIDSFKTNGSLYNLAHNLLLTEEIPALWSQLPGYLQRRFETNEEKVGSMDITFVAKYRKIEHKNTLPITEVVESGLFYCILKNGHDLALKRIWECQCLRRKYAMEVHAWYCIKHITPHYNSLYFFVRHGIYTNYDLLKIELGADHGGKRLLQLIADAGQPWQEYLMPFAESMLRSIFVHGRPFRLPSCCLPELFEYFLYQIDVQYSFRDLPIKRLCVLLWKMTPCWFKAEIVFDCRMFHRQLLGTILTEAEDEENLYRLENEWAKVNGFALPSDY